MTELGNKFLNNGKERKMSVPNSDKWNNLIKNGWVEGYSF